MARIQEGELNIRGMLAEVDKVSAMGSGTSNAATEMRKQ